MRFTIKFLEGQRVFATIEGRERDRILAETVLHAEHLMEDITGHRCHIFSDETVEKIEPIAHWTNGRMFMFVNPRDPYTVFKKVRDEMRGDAVDNVIIERVMYYDTHEQQWIHDTAGGEQNCNPCATVRAPRC